MYLFIRNIIIAVSKIALLLVLLPEKIFHLVVGFFGCIWLVAEVIKVSGSYKEFKQNYSLVIKFFKYKGLTAKE